MSKKTDATLTWKPIDNDMFLKYIKDCRKIGRTDAEISRSLGIKTRELKQCLRDIKESKKKHE